MLPMPMIDYDRFEVLTFDCYGTLIDWESGILAAARSALGDGVANHSDDQLLETFGRHEHEAETPYHRYREVLELTISAMADELGVPLSDEARRAFGQSVVGWPPFPDSAAALARLHERFKLAVITNCDDDLFAASERRLETTFDWVITAEQVGSYKPDVNNFHFAHERIGIDRSRILHVAQSLFHDHVPAKQLGMTTVWINRRAGKEGEGATPTAAQVTPDATFPDMASFAADAV
jgi:2-haloacid dehalogenase